MKWANVDLNSLLPESGRSEFQVDVSKWTHFATLWLLPKPSGSKGHGNKGSPGAPIRDPTALAPQHVLGTPTTSDLTDPSLSSLVWIAEASLVDSVTVLFDKIV